MRRQVPGLLLVLVVLSPASLPAREPGEPVPLLVSSAAPPLPSLKYRLLPDERDRVDGDAATLYYHSQTRFVENVELLQNVQGGPWSVWANMPLAELPRAEVRSQLATVRALLDDLDRASLRRRCDWQLSGRPEGAALLLPEVSGFRSLANVLAVRARLAIAEGHASEAVQSLRSGYALAHHLNQGPTLIHVLVGVAIAQIMDNQLEELLQQPGAPNFYWALATLPRPFFDMSTALRDERSLLERMLPFVKDLDRGPMTAAQVEAAQDQLEQFRQTVGLRPPKALEVLGQAGMQMGIYFEAKTALTTQGYTRTQVEAMPAFQVIALHAYREYGRASDEYLKWFALSDGWRAPGCQESRSQYREAARRLDRVFFGGGVGLEFAPGAERIQAAMSRAERRHAALCCVEALRWYAAEHKGQWPATLKDVTAVPLPSDPLTGRPFEYTVQDGTARLAAPLPDGEKTPPYQRLVYEVRLRTKGQN